MDIPGSINPLLRQLVEDAVIPRYDAFDKGHPRGHAENHRASSDGKQLK